MFLLDPSLGRRRRHVIGDRTRSLAGDAEERLGKTGRNLRNHARGWVAEARKGLRDERVEDEVLVERVRSALGRAASRPSAIEVAAADGEVTLTGSIPASELDGVLSAIADVRGVRALDCGLECYETEAAGEADAGRGEASPAGDGRTGERVTAES
jgi:hypothetical protein